MDADYDYFAEFRREHVEMLIDLADDAVEALADGGASDFPRLLATLPDAP